MLFIFIHEQEMHALFSLSIGLLRILEGIAPIIAASYTTKDPDQFLSLCLVFTFSVLNALGYDVIEHHYGFEAEVYSYLFAALKVVPYINDLSTFYYYWLPVICINIVFQLLKHIPPTQGVGYEHWYQEIPVFLDSWRYTESELYDADHGKDTRPKDKPVPALAWYTTGVMLAMMILYNGLRGLMLYYNVWVTDVYARDSIEAEYSILIEGLLGCIFILRLPAITPRYFTEHSDFWRGIGGLFMMYLFYQITIIVAAKDSQLVIMIVMVLIMFFSALWIYRYLADGVGIARESETSYLYEYFELLQRGVYDLLILASSEPMLDVYYVMICAFIGLSSTTQWYVSTVSFPQGIRAAFCPLLGFVDDIVKFIYVGLSGDLTTVLGLMFQAMGRIKLQVYTYLRIGYPVLEQACNGAVTFMTPTHDIMITLSMAIPWIPGLLLLIQFFPEADLIESSEYFWVTAAGCCFSSLFTTQVYADVTSTFWYIFVPDTTFSREYSTTGAGVATLQVVQLLICFGKCYHRHYALKVQKRLHKTIAPAGTETSASVVGSVTSAVAEHSKIVITNLENIIFGPSYWLITSGCTVLVYAVNAGSPFVNVGFQALPNVLPPWLNLSPTDQFAASITNMGGLIASVLGINQYIGLVNQMVSYLPGVIKDVITGILGEDIGDYIGYQIVAPALNLLWLYVIKPPTLLALQAISPVYASFFTAFDNLLTGICVPGVNQFNGHCTPGLGPLLNGLAKFSLFNLDLSVFRYPNYLIYVIAGILIFSVGFTIFVAFYTDFAWIERIINTMILSLLTSVLVLVITIFDTIKSFDVFMAIEFSSVAPSYAAGFILILMGVMLRFVTQMQHDAEGLLTKSTDTRAKRKSNYNRLLAHRNNIVKYGPYYYLDKQSPTKGGGGGGGVVVKGPNVIKSPNKKQSKLNQLKQHVIKETRFIIE